MSFEDKIALRPGSEEEFRSLVQGMEESLKKEVESYFRERKFWSNISFEDTPPEYIKERKGHWNKELGDYEWLEYFPEEYTINELNRLFPGWWVDEMKVEVHLQLRTIAVTGYLCVEYPTRLGMKIVKRWAIGSSRIEYSKENNKHTGQPDASQPDDDLKAARTEWLKLAGKWFSIGLDIYHQRITPGLRSQFEDIVRTLESEGQFSDYIDKAKQTAASIKTGQGFRRYLKELPSPKQIERFYELLNPVPESAQDKEGNNLKYTLKNKFIELKNREQVRVWLNKIEQISNHFKEKGE